MGRRPGAARQIRLGNHPQAAIDLRDLCAARALRAHAGCCHARADEAFSEPVCSS
jgi:hypothetical protein